VPLLQQCGVDRERSFGPFVELATLIALGTSEPLGIPISTPVLIWNSISILAALAVVVGLRTHRIPHRWGHAAFASLWIVATGGTLLSQHYTHSPGLVLLAYIEVLGVALMLETRYVLCLLLAFDCAWTPITLQGGDSLFALYAATMGCAQVFAVLFHRSQRNALIQVDALRRAQQRTADELACQLDELRRSEAERPRFVFRTDKEKASLAGISTEDIAFTLQMALRGISPGEGDLNTARAGAGHSPRELNSLPIIIQVAPADRAGKGTAAGARPAPARRGRGSGQS